MAYIRFKEYVSNGTFNNKVKSAFSQAETNFKRMNEQNEIDNTLQVLIKNKSDSEATGASKEQLKKSVKNLTTKAQAFLTLLLEQRL